MESELSTLRRANEGLHGLVDRHAERVLELEREMSEQRRLLTAGDVQQAAEVADLRDTATAASVRAAAAETRARWIGIVAALLGVGVVGLAAAMLWR